ncbi:MAG: tetratricopeptide repeat protein [Cytophagales bacterium]|nr:tetratricopeptide repeat protein [Cytophagales bacterium]
MSFFQFTSAYYFLFIPSFLPFKEPVGIDSLVKATQYAHKEALPGLYKEIGVFHYRKKDFPKAGMAFQACVNTAQKSNDPTMAGRCLNNLGAVAFQQGAYADGIQYYRKAIALYEANQLDTLRADGFLNLGLAFKKLNIYDSAISNFYKGINVLEQLDSKSSLMNGYNTLANVLREAQSEEQAQQYYLESILLAEQLKDTLHLSKVYNNLGTLSRKMGHLDSALFYYHESLQLKKRKNVPKLMGNTHYNLGMVFIGLKRADSALFHLKKSSEYRVLAGDHAGLGYNFVALSKSHLINGDLTRADHYLKRSDSLSKELTYSTGLYYDHLGVQRDLFEAQSRFREASQISKELVQLKEKLLDSEKQEVITSYEVRFNVNSLERKLEWEAANRQKNQLIYTLSSIIGGLTILFLIYWVNHKRKEAKRNEILYREIHHRMKNTFSLFGGMITLKRKQNNGEAKKVLLDIGKQLEAVNLVLQKLYFSKTAHQGELDFGEYLKELVKSLFFTTGKSQNTYAVATDFGPVKLAVDQSNRLGLVANEILTNAIKYGQSEDGTWKIKIGLSEHDGEVKLQIRDNGKGICPGDLERNTTGIALVQLLVKQLKGAWNYTNEEGSSFTVQFKK